MIQCENPVVDPRATHEESKLTNSMVFRLVGSRAVQKIIKDAEK